MSKVKAITIDDILKQKQILESNTYFYHSKIYDKDIEICDADKQEVLEIVSINTFNIG